MSLIENMFSLISQTDDKKTAKHLVSAVKSQFEHEVGCVTGKLKLDGVGGTFYGLEDHRPVTKAELDLFATQGKLSAVKEYKNRTGHSLMESKRQIEHVADRLGVQAWQQPRNPEW